MKVLMMLDGLVFVDLKQTQKQDVLQHTGKTKTKETAKGLKVQGSPETLYKLLYDLSYKYDVELV